MPAASLSLKRQISNVIKHFKFEELENTVLPLFPEISWNRVKIKLMKQHQNFSVPNVIRIIEGTIDDCKIAENFLKERLTTLEVIDISRHYTKKCWYCYELKSPETGMSLMTKRHVKEKVIQFFRLENIDVDVQTIFNNGILFASIKEKPRGNKRVNVTPIFFALLLGQKYFFCSNKRVANDYIRGIASAMGSGNSKRIKLFGKDLPSLIKLLWQKKQGTIDAITDEVPYRDSNPEIKSTGIDFTQNKNRKEYLKGCFGNEPPTLNSIVLDVADQKWLDQEAASKLPDKKISVGWEFRSHNVASFLQSLAQNNIIVFPVPLYLSQWMTTGRNQLTLHET